jgi:hypothetical protein
MCHNEFRSASSLPVIKESKVVMPVILGGASTLRIPPVGKIGNHKLNTNCNIIAITKDGIDMPTYENTLIKLSGHL